MISERRLNQMISTWESMEPDYGNPYLEGKSCCLYCDKYKDDELFSYDAHFGDKPKTCDECYEYMGYDVYMKDRNITEWFTFDNDMIWHKSEEIFLNTFNIKRVKYESKYK